MARFTVEQTVVNGNTEKVISWSTDDGRYPYPDLQEILDTVQSEFPGVPYAELEVSCGWPPGEAIAVHKK